MPLFEIIAVVSFLIIAYHYIGYPIMLWVWYRLRTQAQGKSSSDQLRPTANAKDGRSSDSPSKSDPALVSLIVSAYNEEDVIIEKLGNSLALESRTHNLEIIVVADGSDDATVALVNDFIARTTSSVSIRLLHDDKRAGKSAAINRAVKYASGELLVFSDANAMYKQDALTLLIERFQDLNVGAVSGNKTVFSKGIGESEGLYWRYESAIKTLESNISSSTGVVGEMFAMRRSLYTDIPSHIINDDAYLGMMVVRNGHRVVYEKNAVCVENPSASLKDEMNRRRRISAGRFQLLFDRSLWPMGDWRYVLFYWSHKFLRLMLGPLMLALLLSTTVVVLAGQATWFIALLFALQAIAYMLAGLNRFTSLASRFGRWSRMTKVCDYFISSNLSTIPAFVHFLQGRESVLWQRAQRLP